MASDKAVADLILLATDGRPIRASFASICDAIETAVAAIADAKIDIPAGAVGSSAESELLERVARAAHPGQLLITDVAARGVDLTDAEFVLLPLGTHWLPGEGAPERILQVVHPILRVAFPPLRGLDLVLHNFEPEATPFIGRTREIEALTDALARPGLVTLTGAGGVGKSRLAAHAACMTASRWRDGAWRVALDTSADVDVAETTLRLLRIADNKGQPHLVRLTDHLADRDLLLLLDGCEAVVAEAAVLAETVRTSCPYITILATSREPLGIPGEVVHRVAPLATDEALELFLEHAKRARENFRATAEQEQIVREICDRLDGIPLAIQLAAARVRSMSPEAILAGLDDRFRLLTGRRGHRVARQATLLASIEWSHSLLSDRERDALRRLAVFSGPWNLDAAERVVSLENIDPVTVLDLVSDLVDKSLVVVDPDGACRLLESVREFALDRLVEAGEAEAARHRHLEHYAKVTFDLAATAETTADPGSLRALDSQRDNIRAAIEWAVATGDDVGRRMAVALTPYWILRGDYRDGTSLLERWPEDAEALVALGQLRLLAMDAGSGFGVADALRARDLISPDDTRTLARTLLHTGFVESYLGIPTGPAQLTEAVALAERAGDPWARIWATACSLWTSGIARDDHAAGEDAVRSLERLAEELQNTFVRVLADLGRGLRAVRVDGDVIDARARLRSALESCRAVGEPGMEMFITCALAEAERLAGNWSVAAEELERSHARLEGSARGRADVVRVAQAALADALGNDSAAALLIDSALPAVRAVGAPELVAEALTVLGRTRADALDEALALARTARNPRLEADVLERKGAHNDALALRWGNGFRPATVSSLEAIAATSLATRRSVDAVTILAGCTEIRDRHGWHRLPRDEGGVLDLIGQLEDRLGDEFGSAWARGRQLDLERAVRLATRARSARRMTTVGWDALTPTESAVVELVASGLSNPEVADRLLMSRATVKTHLLHAYAKVGVRNRSELAAAWAARNAGRD